MSEAAETVVNGRLRGHLSRWVGARPPHHPHPLLRPSAQMSPISASREYPHHARNHTYRDCFVSPLCQGLLLPREVLPGVPENPLAGRCWGFPPLLTPPLDDVLCTAVKISCVAAAHPGLCTMMGTRHAKGSDSTGGAPTIINTLLESILNTLLCLPPSPRPSSQILCPCG